MRPRVLSRNLVLAGIGAILTGAVLGTGVARADGVISNDEATYVQTYGAGAVCLVISEYPNEAGVYGVMQAIMEDGFAADSAVDIINASVDIYCDQYWPLLERIGAQARGELAHERMI